MDVCAVFHVVLSRKKKGEERVGVGGRGKYPGAPPHKGKKRKKPTARYLIDQYSEKGKAKKLKKKKKFHMYSWEHGISHTNFYVIKKKLCSLSFIVTITINHDICDHD
jgi:hypothetical protein